MYLSQYSELRAQIQTIPLLVSRRIWWYAQNRGKSNIKEIRADRVSRFAAHAIRSYGKFAILEAMGGATET